MQNGSPSETEAQAVNCTKASLLENGNAGVSTGSAISLPYSCILEATENLAESRKLGKGAFSIVYRGDVSRIVNAEDAVLGCLASWPLQVAMKVPIEKDNTSKMAAWMAAADETELRVLSKYSHRNMCCLLGFSVDGPKRTLVFELCTGGSLSERLALTATNPTTGKIYPPLTSQHRFEIIAELARALEYLHCGESPGVVHR